MAEEPLRRHPLWVEHSGLPTLLLREGKSPVAWMLLRRVMELDLAQHRHKPGVVELEYGAFLDLAGLDENHCGKAMKILRKCGLLRAYVPDHREESVLLQVLTPLATPIPALEVLRSHAVFAHCRVEDLRYATACAEDSGVEKRLREVIDLYLDVLSMRVNSLVVDNLRVVAERYDLELIRRVFARAKKREGTGLSWIMAEIRREDLARRGTGKSDEAGVG